MEKIELTAPLVIRIHEVLNALPRSQVNALCVELEKQIAEHNQKQEKAPKNESK